MASGERSHLKRWLTGILTGIPLLFLLVGPLPRWIFYGLLYGASVAGVGEFYQVTSNLPKRIRFCAYTVTLLLFIAVYFRQLLLMPVLVLMWLWVPMILLLFHRSAPAASITSELGKASAGPVYVALPLTLLMWIDLLPLGNWWILFLLVVVFATDTGAFYFGRVFGRHKLYDRISPKKTWEGAAGGIFLSLIAGLLFLRLFGLHPLVWQVFLLIVLLSVAGQIGDLAESMLKRSHGVKDSGSLLPGHGGILDRIDGLLFSVPVLFAYLYLFPRRGM